MNHNFSVVMDRSTHKRLKIRAAEHECKIGDVVSAMIRATSTGIMTPDEFAVFLKPAAGWVGEDNKAQ